MIDPKISPTEQHRTILVVEDEVLIRLLICEALRGAGLRIVEAVNADQALAYLKSCSDVDLVFSDVRMPGSIDGVALAKCVRSEFPSLPVVLTSGHLLPQDVDEDAVLITKPYSVDDTVARLIAILEVTRGAR